MDGQGGRGAYAQVTAPIGEDGQVTVKPSGKNRGASSVCTAKRLLIAAGIVLIIVIIIVIAVLVSNKSSSSEITSANTTTIAAIVTSMMGAATQSTIKSTTTQPTPAPTTFGPPVRGSFTGAIVLDTPYLRSYDDVRAQGTDELMTNFTQAMDKVYAVPSAVNFIYQNTIVDQIVDAQPKVQVNFTVSLDAINRGARNHLLTTLGSFPSDVMDTYTVLSVDTEPEKKTSLDA
ncbi:uncharacterized protein LOC121422408 isoform X1 [Lytechinus variegatus]|uniref:uncharacterized protein LOC121422408 isoform X1 n=1 Tax=Lytechinus variegatus TaxID=7654 RepID=UPI001BB139C0|nr:uncharacterized protein LOC121422408 isoform X1 [Lytechinus variegatus]